MKKFVYLFLMALLPLFIHAKVVKIDGIWYNIPGLSTVVSVACDPSPASGAPYLRRILPLSHRCGDCQ